MITPPEIQALAEPIESIYIGMTNELMVNIGKHITSPTWTHTAAWEIQKLSEMGQLTEENAAIINRWIKQIPDTVRDTMEETRRIALSDIEKTMEQAAEKGYVTPPLADSTVQVLRDYEQQAADKLNLVNTTMLESSLEQYRRAVELTEEIVQQKENTQKALNEAAGSVATGVETRTEAMRRAIDKIAQEGLTGFYDKAGRSWSPEAYVNMDIRTTVHNVAIESTRNRMQDYNTSVFQISSHAGARPLCYPYQGGFYSWDNTSGEIELGDGRSVRYEPINNTTYGEPAGIFGINCGHFPIPIIPGYTIPHGADNIQPKELNDKTYQESQQQRALERQIRAAKRVVAMGDTSDKAKKDVAEAQAKMRQFIADTGRTRRYDREKIYPSGQTAAPQQQAPVAPQPAPQQESLKFADSAISKICDYSSVEYREVSKRDKPLSDEEIVKTLGGGDKTGGSCASVGLAYIGQKQGLNVLDFRGGESMRTFSSLNTLKKFKDIPGVAYQEYSGRYEITLGKKMLNAIQPGKEYYFGVGKHAAIVRKNDDGKYQYMELQSVNQNGWTDFNGNLGYTLNWRFGCRKSRLAYYEGTGITIEVDSLTNSPEFNKILGYINTAENEQRKGQGGSIK